MGEYFGEHSIINQNLYNLLNQRDNFGKTPLHIACKHGDYSCIKELILMGADPNIGKDDEGFTPMEYCSFHKINNKNLYGYLNSERFSMKYTTFSDDNSKQLFI